MNILRKAGQFILVGALLACLPVAVMAQSLQDVAGVYVSQFAPSDPQAARGGTNAVVLVVVVNGRNILATVNAQYTDPKAGWTSNVWSYGLFPDSGGAASTVQIVDSFGVCDNTVRATFLPQSYSIQVESLATSQKVGVANPLGITCADLYPVPLTRVFKRIF